MTASELSKRFLLWFQNQYKDAKIFRNNRGMYKTPDGNWIRYGIPTPQGKGKDKLKGSDYISWHTEYTGDSQILCISKFWEIKTIKDSILDGQKNFMNLMVKMGADCFIIHEGKIPKDKELLQTENSLLDTEFLLNHGFYIEKWRVK